MLMNLIVYTKSGERVFAESIARERRTKKESGLSVCRTYFLTAPCIGTFRRDAETIPFGGRWNGNVLVGELFFDDVEQIRGWETMTLISHSQYQFYIIRCQIVLPS